MMIFYLLIIFSMLSHFSSAHRGVYNVATSKDLCHEELDDSCNTWEYFQQNQTLLSQSNTEWRLMSGRHLVKSGITAFKEVRNVTITGVADNCTLYCKGSNLCQLLFMNSSDIHIYNLNVIYPSKLLPLNITSIDTFYNVYGVSQNLTCFTSKSSNCNIPFPPYTYEHCIYNRAWIFVNVVNLTIQNITFQGYHTQWAIVYSRCNGFLNVKNVNFTKMAPWHKRIHNKSTVEPKHHVMVAVHPWNYAIHLALSFDEISFSVPANPSKQSTESDIFIPASIHIICDNQWEKEGQVNITMNKVQCLNVPILQVNSINNPGISVVLKNSTAIMNIRSPEHIRYLVSPALSIFLSDQGKKSEEKCKHTLHGNTFLVQIEGVIIKGFISNIGAGILHVVENYCKASLKGVLLLKENQFFHNTGLNFGGIFYADYKRYKSDNKYNQHNRDNSNNSSNYKIIMLHNRFIQNTVNRNENIICKHASYSPNASIFQSKRECKVVYSNFINGYYPNQREMSRGVVTLSGFKSYGRVIYQANVIKKNNEGNAISLNNTNLQLQMPPELEYSKYNYYEKGVHNDLKENRGLFGGGLFLGGSSKLLLTNNLIFKIKGNRVSNSGGGMYIQGDYDNGTTSSPCFYQIVDENGNFYDNISIKDLNITVKFTKNYATAAEELFAPHLDSCHLYTHVVDANMSDVFNKIFNIRSYSSGNITSCLNKILLSNPRHIYTCNLSTNTKEITIRDHYIKKLYPGQDLELNIIVVADRGIPLSIPLSIQCFQEKIKNKTSLSHYLPCHYTFLNTSCSGVIIPFSKLDKIRTSSNLYLLLNVPLIAQDFMVSDFYHSEALDVQILSFCPLGFTLDDDLKKCQCHVSLQKSGIRCFINNMSFALPPQTWIGTTASEINNTGLLYSTACPKFYCKQRSNLITVTLNDSYQQCIQGREGLLCSRCPNGQGESFGSIECVECSYAGLLYIFLALILSVFLVIIICTFNLTISTRSINGFLFYTHIISINEDIIPKLDKNNPFVAIGAIVHVLSLHSPGFQLCFYPGMDRFAVIMFSIISPIAFLVIVGSAFFLPKLRCINIHKVHMTVGPRITPVLATMIMFSFSKFFDIVLSSLLYTDVCDLSTQECWKVWFYDGNLKYFNSPRHIVLGVVSLAILLFFLIPIMTTIIFGDLLKRCIRKHWYWNFIDTFYCSYKFRFGFWIGIRILFRFIVMTAKILLTNEETIFLTICIVQFIIIFQIVFRPFRHLRFEKCLPRRLKENYFTEEFSKFLANMNDNIFMINIAVLLSAFLLSETQNIQGIVVLLSEMVALLQFSIIFIYHTFEYSPFGPKIVQCFKYMHHFFKTLKLFLFRRKKSQDTSTELSYHELNTPQMNIVLRPFDEQSDSNSETSEESSVEPRESESQAAEMHEVFMDREEVNNVNSLMTPLLVEQKI